jgi:RNA polymerase sigma factor (sigma-70 family)
MRQDDSIKLLHDYAERGDEAAFRELVARYVDLVYSTAVRRVGGDADLARDVTQMVFTDLARKAESLRNVELLGGWLHRHTGFVASSIVRGERRRQAREQETAEMNALQDSPDSLWQQMAPLLDETMDVLEAPDRQAIVLRFFERRDFRAVGAALGISDDAAQKRVTRALEKLRELLANRGVTLSLALLSSFMAGRAVSAAPAGLANEVAKVALAGAASATGITLALTKLAGSLTCKLALGAVALGAAAWLLWPGRFTQRPDPARQGSAVAALSGSEGPAAPAAQSPLAASGSDATLAGVSTNRLVLTIVAADAGKPVPDVQLDYWLWEGEKVAHKKPLQANRFGVCVVPVPDGTTELLLVSRSEGFADTRLEWRTDRGEKIPAEYTLPVARSAPISGKVVDQDGQPVANAKVGFNNQTDPASETRPQCDDFGWPFWITATTDTEGRWRIDRIANKAIRTIYGGASHPEYVGSQFIFVGRTPDMEKQLLAGTHIFELGRAVTVRGSVVDSDGQAVPDANVLVGHQGESGRRETKTRPDGSFSVSGCKPGKNVLTAEAHGYAATTLTVDLKAESEPFQLKLQHGKVLKLRIVGSNGNPIAKAGVWLDTFERGPINLPDTKPAPVQIEFNRQTDNDGRLEWDSAPDQDLSFGISASGYMRSDDVKVRPDGGEHLVTLTPALTISGTVRDASSGKAVPRFRIITGWPTWHPSDNTTNYQWSPIDRFWLSFEGGKFHHCYEEPVVSGTADPTFVFKFEADGYAPFITRAVKATEGEVRFEVALCPALATPVTVLLPDGRPASGTDIGLVSKGARLNLVPGGFSRDNVQSGGSLLLTDSQGRFNLAQDESITSVIAVNAQGIAEASPSALTTEPTLTLQPWGRLEGTYLSGGEGAVDREVLFIYGQGAFDTVSSDFTAYRVKTDSEGRFAFSKVPPGKHRLVRVTTDKDTGASSWSSDHPLMEVVIRPGETTVVTIGGSNYCVIAHLHWPAGLNPGTNAHVFASIRNTPWLTPPPDALNNPQALAAWRTQPEVKADLANRRYYNMTQKADGSWVADDVLPSSYTMTVSIFRQVPAEAGQPKTLATAEVPLTVPADPPTGKLDLGEILLQPVP